jgi:hypothetical protein
VQVETISQSEAAALRAKAPPRVLEYWAKRHVQAQRSFAAALADLVNHQRLLPVPVAPEAAAAPRAADPSAEAATKEGVKPAAEKARRPRSSAAADAVANRIEPYLNGHAEGASERLVGVH